MTQPPAPHAVSERLALVLPLVTLLALASAALALIVLELLPTGLSSLSAATSQYALTPYAWGFRWFEVSLAAAAAAIAAAIAIGWPGRRAGIVIAIAVLAFGRSFVGWVNMDAPSAPATLRGDIHWTLGLASFIATIVAMFLTARLLRHQQNTSAAGVFSLVMGWITLACVGLLLLAVRVTPLTGFFGLFERGYYLSTLIWLAVLAAHTVQARSRDSSLTSPTG